MQIVEEQSERVLRSGERAEKPAKHKVEAILRVLGRDFQDGRLLANYELQFGDKVYQELTICTHSLQDRIPPMIDFRLILTQDLAHKVLERLRQGGVRDIPFVLVELPRNENAARPHDHLVQLIYDRGFADPRVTRHEHQLWFAASDDSIKGAKKDFALRVTPI